jgi:hypothetical protein
MLLVDPFVWLMIGKRDPAAGDADTMLLVFGSALDPCKVVKPILSLLPGMISRLMVGQRARPSS